MWFPDRRHICLNAIPRRRNERYFSHGTSVVSLDRRSSNQNTCYWASSAKTSLCTNFSRSLLQKSLVRSESRLSNTLFPDKRFPPRLIFLSATSAPEFSRMPLKKLISFRIGSLEPNTFFSAYCENRPVLLPLCFEREVYLSTVLVTKSAVSRRSRSGLLPDLRASPLDTPRTSFCSTLPHRCLSSNCAEPARYISFLQDCFFDTKT